MKRGPFKELKQKMFTRTFYKNNFALDVEIFSEGGGGGN